MDLAEINEKHFLTETVQERIEIIVFDNEDAIVRMFDVVAGGVIDNLQTQRSLTASLFTKHDCRRWRSGITKNLVPCGVKRSACTELLEQWVGLSVLLTEWILLQAMVLKKLLNFHRDINFRFF